MDSWGLGCVWRISRPGARLTVSQCSCIVIKTQCRRRDWSYSLLQGHRKIGDEYGMGIIHTKMYYLLQVCGGYKYVMKLV